MPPVNVTITFDAADADAALAEINGWHVVAGAQISATIETSHSVMVTVQETIGTGVTPDPDAPTVEPFMTVPDPNVTPEGA